MKPLPSSKVGLLKQFTKAFLHCFVENKLSPYFVGYPMLQAVSCAVIMVLVVPWKNKTASLQWKGLKSVEGINGFKQEFWYTDYSNNLDK